MSSILPIEVCDQAQIQSIEARPVKTQRFSTTPVKYESSSLCTVRMDPRNLIINDQVIIF